MPKPSKLKAIPKFRSESEEREFWESADSAGHVDWKKARIGLFPNLKPSTETISLRLPASLLAELKALANQRDVPYQSLLKIYLAERISMERGESVRQAPVRTLRRSAGGAAVTTRPAKRGSSRP